MTFVDVKNADELEVIPDILDDEGLKEAYEEAAQHNWTREEYDACIYSGMREQDEKGRMELAELRAEERKLNTLILAMNSKGLSLGMIAEITGLDEVKILEIIRNQ